jgi:TRAP-type mannitol/chloroaromatic compound transport system permease small subunit
MKALLALSRAIDGFGYFLSRIAVWLVLIAALLSAGNAFFRYFINELIHLAGTQDRFGILQQVLTSYGQNSNSFLEAQWYMFGAMAMLGAAYTLKVNEHVRVDLIYGWVSERTRTWIDLFGGIVYLLPMCWILAYLTWPWFVDAWFSGEVSTNAGGLIRWPAKLILPAGFALIFIQGISEIIKCVAVLTSDYHREHAYEKPLQ